MIAMIIHLFSVTDVYTCPNHQGTDITSHFLCLCSTKILVSSNNANHANISDIIHICSIRVLSDYLTSG